MDARDPATFEAVARLGGMGRAARELNTVQSNVTQRVRRLEEALGVSLFERSRAGARLTPAGERLMPYATRVDALLDEAGRAARDDGAPRGTLTVGSLETTAALRLSPLLASYVQAHPGVDFVLRTGTTAEMVERVLDRELEGAFVCGPVVHPQLICAAGLCRGTDLAQFSDRVVPGGGPATTRPASRHPAGRLFLPAATGGGAGAARCRGPAPTWSSARWKRSWAPWRPGSASR